MNELNTIAGTFQPTSGRVAIVASRFNDAIVKRLIEGASDTLVRHGISVSDIDVIWTPGAFELPLALKVAANSGRYQGLVALGTVIRGATPHFDYVAGECASGISRIALESGIPIGFGVLTTETIEQALERSGTKAGNKGVDAALACIEMMDLVAKLNG